MSRGTLDIKQRILFLFGFFVLLLLILTGRLFWIQIVQTDVLRGMAVEQRLRLLNIEPSRGIIYDRGGKELAVSTTAETVVALPPEILDTEYTARELAPVLNLSYQEILQRISQPRAAIYLERKLDDERVNEIKKMALPGITFIPESKRFYPQGELASHVLGFAGIDSQGLEGLEVALDRYLAGIPGRMSTEKDAVGREIPGGVQRYIPPQDGLDVYLTIDQVIQFIAERELDQAMLDNEAKGGTILVMEPNSGEILAMANRPSFDPNDFQAYSSETWRNSAISDSYEPGSAFKIITMAAALDEGVVNIEDRFFDPGHIKVGGEIIRCWKAGGHGSQTFKEVVEHSCNPGFVQVGMRLGKDNFFSYLNAFNFGRRLGIDLPGEARGMMYTYDELGPVELATMTFGHGIAVTPLQMVTATSAVANGGFLMQPRLVREVRDKEGNLIEDFRSRVIRQVISQETSEITRALLVDVVETGTGTNAQIDGYKIGGKTGTAKWYGVEKYDASFIGIVPVDDPQLVILVVLYGVSSAPYYGGTIAAPVFRDVALDTIRYLGIKPTIPEEVPIVEAKTEKRTIPNTVNQPVLDAVEQLRVEGFNVRLEGEGEVVRGQVPLAGAEVEVGTTVILFFEDDSELKERYYVTVPDLREMNLKEAGDILASLGFKLDFTGSGTVVAQDPAAGERLATGSVVKLTLR